MQKCDIHFRSDCLWLGHFSCRNITPWASRSWVALGNHGKGRELASSPKEREISQLSDNLDISLIFLSPFLSLLLTLPSLPSFSFPLPSLPSFSFLFPFPPSSFFPPPHCFPSLTASLPLSLFFFQNLKAPVHLIGQCPIHFPFSNTNLLWSDKIKSHIYIFPFQLKSYSSIWSLILYTVLTQIITKL